MCESVRALRESQGCLIERPNANEVELMIMSRTRTMLLIVIPALFLLASLDCFSGPVISSGCNLGRCLFSAGGHRQSKSSCADNPFDQTVRRWGRRISVQPRTDGFASTLALVHAHFPPPNLTVYSVCLHRVHSGLPWQFLWRTASEPRAPSLVS